MAFPAYSVLISVYAKEHPEYLRQSMESMFTQTVPTDDFVLICDGPLTQGLDAVIAQMQSKFGPVLRVFRFEQNGGLGHALRTGVTLCKNDLIARMDSDDISRPDRCEKELAFMVQHPEVSIVGGWIEEFSQTPDKVESVRAVPETSEQIMDYAKVRCPFNHPSVMFRKNDVLAAGNYAEVCHIQDYYLWAAMLVKGYKGYNLQEPLVWMRADESFFKRRGGKEYVKLQVDLFRYMRQNGFITWSQYLRSIVLRTGSGLAPNWMRQFAFKHMLRSNDTPKPQAKEEPRLAGRTNHQSAAEPLSGH